MTKKSFYVTTADSVNIYLIKITDFKTNESVSPLDFVKDNIKNLIINKRKLALIEQMQKSAFDQALKNNDFEIYK